MTKTIRQPLWLNLRLTLLHSPLKLACRLLLTTTIIASFVSEAYSIVGQRAASQIRPPVKSTTTLPHTSIHTTRPPIPNSGHLLIKRDSREFYRVTYGKITSPKLKHHDVVTYCKNAVKQSKPKQPVAVEFLNMPEHKTLAMISSLNINSQEVSFFRLDEFRPKTTPAFNFFKTTPKDCDFTQAKLRRLSNLPKYNYSQGHKTYQYEIEIPANGYEIPAMKFGELEIPARRYRPRPLRLIVQLLFAIGTPPAKVQEFENWFLTKFAAVAKTLQDESDVNRFNETLEREFRQTMDKDFLKNIFFKVDTTDKDIGRVEGKNGNTAFINTTGQTD